MEQAALSASTTTSDRAAVDDEAMIARIAGGDRRAFEALYRAYYRRVSQFVYKLTPNQQLGEEIVDDTMLAVWKSAARFAGRSKVSTWILGIAYRRTMKTLSKEKKHRGVDRDDEAAQLVDTDAARDPLAAAAATGMRREIDTFIGMLNADQQVALRLTAMGHSYPEISVIMDCPANTVKTRVFKARRKLKACMSDAGIRI